MAPLKHPKNSGHGAKHDPKVAASELMSHGRKTAAAHAKRPDRKTHERLHEMLRGSGAKARRPDRAAID